MAYKDNITDYGFGQLGSVFLDINNTQIKPPTGKVFVAITFISDTVLDNSGGLVADTEYTGVEFIGTEAAAHDAGAGSETGVTGSQGQVIDNSNVFPRGLTIYGRWTAIRIKTGENGILIAYIGD